MTVDIEQDRATVALQDRPIIGHRKRQLLRDIAIGDLSLEEIGRKWKRSYQHIRRVASENKEEIAEIKEQFNKDFDRDLNRIWLSGKFERLAERVKSYRAICEHMTKLEEESEEYGMAVGEHWLRYETAKQKVLKDIAEELGQLVQRAPSTDNANTVRLVHEIVGVDMDKALPEAVNR